MQDEGLGEKLYYNDVYVYQNVKEVSSLRALTSLSMVVRAAINQWLSNSRTNKAFQYSLDQSTLFCL